MKNYIDDEFMKVFGEGLVVSLVWKSKTKELTQDQFKRQASKFIAIVEEVKPKGIIVDMREFRYKLNPELVSWRDKNIIGVYNKIRFSKFAFISKKRVLLQDDSVNTFKTRNFPSMQEAKEWLR
jgi:hypothetical protein